MTNQVITKTTPMRLVKFSQPYTFEGKEYTEIDLSVIENIDAEQLCEAEKMFETGGNFSALKEMNLAYALTVAAVVTQMPIEFYKKLPGKDALKVKNAVSSYFFN